MAHHSEEFSGMIIFLVLYNLVCLSVRPQQSYCTKRMELAKLVLHLGTYSKFTSFSGPHHCTGTWSIMVLLPLIYPRSMLPWL
jgi:hypothetical protein